jgi:hypothetical protein
LEANGPLLRTHARRCGAYLALAALTLQFALSFAHTHPHDIGYPGLAYSDSLAHSDKLARPNMRVLAGSQALVKQELSKQLPSPLADDGEHCPICLSTLLLATSFIPDAPRYSASSDFTAAGRFFGRSLDLVFRSDRAPFQSRAPPLS